MIKKKYLILLSTLLLVLLSSLFTTSYAFEYEVTNSDIDSIVEYYFPSHSSKATAKSNLYWALGRIYNDFGMDFVTINVETYGSGQIQIKGFDSSYISSVSYLNNANYMNVTFSSTTKVFKSTINMYNGARSSSYTDENNCFFGSGSQFRTVYLMYSNDILDYSGPWQNVEILQFVPPIQFTYVYNPNLQNVTVEEIPYNNGEMKAITYSGVNNRTYLCIFGDYDQLDHVYMDFYRYNTSLGEWTHYKTIESYTDYEVEDNQIRLYFSGNYYANTICMLGFIPKTR